MYIDLIKALRETDFSEGCPCTAQELCEKKDCIIIQAADAIEELEQLLGHFEQSTWDFWKEACDYKAQLQQIKGQQ